MNRHKDIKLFVMDFDGVLTDNFVYVDSKGNETVRCSRADGFGLSKLKNLGIDLLVISKEINPIVAERCKKLGLKCIQNEDDKLKSLNEYIAARGIKLHEVAFIGNDVNDIEVMNHVGFPVAVQDAFPEVKNVASHITCKKGGEGAVREFCEYLVSEITEA